MNSTTHVRSAGFPVPRSLCALLLGIALATWSAAPAEGQQVGQPGGMQELGIDAGAVIGLGDVSSVSISLPAARARWGFFLANSNWSVEPAVGLQWIKVEGADGVLFYELEGGALYHFRPPGDVVTADVRVLYFRPFVGIVGFTGEESDSELSIGAGLGAKVPWRQDLAFRFEANTGYGFDNEAFRIGAFVGLSFFTPRL